jgi:hypothetical protein
MPEIRTVELSPPQPCGVLDPASGRICGQPAVRATVEAAPQACAGAAGYLLVLPVCPACSRGVGRAFAPDQPAPEHVTVLTTTVHIPDNALPGAFLDAAQFLDGQAARLQRDAYALRERALELARMS